MTSYIKELLLLPTLNKNIVYHVGSLDLSQKKSFSYEGTGGLSISTEPDAWRQINRGQTVGDTHQLCKPHGSFLDANNFSQEQREYLLHWGLMKGLLYPCQQYSYSYFDDELDDQLTFYFDSIEEAKAEADNEQEIITIDSFKGTDQFAQIVGYSCKDDLSLIAVAFCLLETDLDGVYWDSEVDVLRYAAPRGIILQSKLEEWTVQN